MNVLVLLAAILFVLMVVIGGNKGARSFISLFLNFAVIFLTVFFLMTPQANPIIVTLIACIIISCITLFYINDVNSKTVTAFIATMITIIIMFSLIYFITKHALIQGFGDEEAEEIRIFSLYIGIDFIQISTAVIIMSTIGAITDVAISITSPMWEIYRHHPNLRRSELFTSGMTIGKDILGSNTNTLFFAFIGGYIALLIWFKDLAYSFGDIINSKIFSAEMMMILCAGIGIAIITPISALINAMYLIYRRDKQKKLDDRQEKG